MNKIQVFVVSKQSLFRQGVEFSLSSISDIEVLGSAEANGEALLAIDSVPPDVAIVDVDSISDGGLMLARMIKQRLPCIGIIALSSSPNDRQLFQALKTQVAAYLNKEISVEELADAIRRVAGGEHPINESLVTRPNIANQVLAEFQELSWRSEAFISPLTPRETQILNYIAQGYLNKQIAIELSISEQTIKNHVTSILRKLNANARTEAVVIGIKQGLISLN
jgi:DNA-binding NarL/FixJ family response regulator